MNKKNMKNITKDDAIKMLLQIIDYLRNIDEKPIRPKNNKKTKSQYKDIDIIKIYYEKGEDEFKKYLDNLHYEDLRFLISHYGLDKTKTTKNWKNEERLRNYILEQIKIIANKGSAFNGNHK